MFRPAEMKYNSGLTELDLQNASLEKLMSVCVTSCFAGVAADHFKMLCQTTDEQNILSMYLLGSLMDAEKFILPGSPTIQSHEFYKLALDLDDRDGRKISLIDINPKGEEATLLLRGHDDDFNGGSVFITKYEDNPGLTAILHSNKKEKYSVLCTLDTADFSISKSMIKHIDSILEQLCNPKLVTQLLRTTITVSLEQAKQLGLLPADRLDELNGALGEHLKKNLNLLQVQLMSDLMMLREKLTAKYNESIELYASRDKASEYVKKTDPRSSIANGLRWIRTAGFLDSGAPTLKLERSLEELYAKLPDKDPRKVAYKMHCDRQQEHAQSYTR